MSAPISWIRCFFTLCLVSLLAGPARPLPAGTQPEPVRRGVLALYSSAEGQSPGRNPIFEMVQTVLNYHGLMPVYVDACRRPLPDRAAMEQMRGIITWFHENQVPAPGEYLRWLNRQMDAGKRIVILGQTGTPGLDSKDADIRDLTHKLFRGLGVENKGHYTTSAVRIRFRSRLPEGVEFERKYPILAPVYEQFTPLDTAVQPYLVLHRKGVPESDSAMIFTSPRGGMAYSGYIHWSEPIPPFRKQWHLNPFLFFEQALGTSGIPRPDPTTLNGCRVAFSHIDGDAFPGPTRIQPDTTCGEIIRDRILKSYDFPVSVSFITGRLDPAAMGSPKAVAVARDILALPNVEPASHAYSHPFFWDADDPEQKPDQYDSQYGLPIPGYTFDPEMEIAGSVNYITREIAPADKPCRLFFWTGNCLPTKGNIAICDREGILNINGGDTIFDQTNNSVTSVAPLYRKVGERYQIHCGQANENILTNLWTGPYYGYRDIITTMRNTGHPRRLKPIDIYYHFYSGEYPASLKALREVVDWVIARPVAPVFTSRYLEMVQGYLRTRILRLSPDAFAILDYGACTTLRLDDGRIPDLTRCQNVLGYTREAQGVYISLHPDATRAEVVLTAPGDSPRQPYLQRATGTLRLTQDRNGSLTVDYGGFGSNGRIEMAGMVPNRAYALSGSALPEGAPAVTADGAGVLTIAPVSAGRIRIEAAE